MIAIEGLYAFIAIAETGNFSRAADKLGVVQSVVSKRLRRLEDQLGTQLVDRSNRTNISLTRAGKVFVEQALHSIATLERTEQVGRNIGRGTSGPLRIGFVFSATLNGALKVLLSFAYARFPGLSLQPMLMDTPEQVHRLQTGEIDIALLRPRPSYPHGCQSQIIQSEPLSLYISGANPLSRVKRLEARHLHQERFIVPQFEERVGLIESIHRLARAGKFESPQIVRTGDFVTAACLAATGYGVTLAPSSLSQFRVDNLHECSLLDHYDTVDMACVWRLDAPREIIRMVDEWCLAQFKQGNPLRD